MAYESTVEAMPTLEILEGYLNSKQNQIMLTCMHGFYYRSLFNGVERKTTIPYHKVHNKQMVTATLSNRYVGDHHK